MQTVTLQGEDFKTVHNTLCDLRNLQMVITGVVNSRIEDQLNSIIKGFEAGLSDAYKQDNDAFDRKMDHYSSVQEAEGLRTIWSIYEVDDLYAPHPFIGAEQIAYKDHWGAEPVFRGIDGNRWVDLYRAADSAIRASGDDHHVFIELFKPNPDCPAQLILSTGS